VHTTVQFNNKIVQQYKTTSLHNSVNKQQVHTTVQFNNKIVQQNKTTSLHNSVNKQRC
jgi:hypothetical protein